MVHSEVHVVRMEETTPVKTVEWADYLGQDEEMELEETLHDSIPRYLIDLVPTWSKSPTKRSSNRQPHSTGMPDLEDVPPDEEQTEKEVGIQGEDEERPSSSDSESSSCSCSSSDSEKDDQEDEPANGGEINEEAYNEPDPSYLQQLELEEVGDQGHLQRLEADYKGTETTREEMCRVKESYHATPNVDDDDLLRGEAMDASPRTETALLAKMENTPATGVGRGISEEETLAAVVSISDPSMPMEAEFLNTDVDMEESPESFEPLSHQTPHLPEIPEKKPPVVTDWTPKKKRGKPSGKGRKHRR